MKSIQLFGVGCTKYRTLLANLHQALAQANIDVKVEEIDDIQLFFEKKIAEVPSLVIDGQVVVQGEAPSVSTLLALLLPYQTPSFQQK